MLSTTTEPGRQVAVFCLLILTGPSALFAQTDTATQHEHHAAPSITEDLPLFVPREASGTAWLPDETPMYGLYRRWGRWQLMFHGSVVGQWLYEPADRHRTGGFSKHQLSSANWGMVMARRPAGRGRVGLRAMATAEPWTVSDCGFINFLAAGEMCQGDTIHDRQHPHDLFMELAMDYDQPLRGSLRWQVYGGLSGEPALGPPGFPHRLSAMANPVAPVTHHWLDSSHITFGLVTTGVYTDRWKAEVSLFNGREPDAVRWNLDLAPLDSFSGRLSVMATSRLTFQISSGHLHGAEKEFAPRPRSDVNRTTASATYHVDAAGRLWASTIAYGVNSGPEVLPTGPVQLVTHAGLAETTLVINERHTVFGRLEVVGKPAHDLHAHEFGGEVFPVAKLEAGYVRLFRVWRGVVPGVGGTFSLNAVPRELSPYYSGQFPIGLGAFLTVRPPRHGM